MMRKYRFIILPCVILLSLFTYSCSEDEPVSCEEFQAIVKGNYFVGKTGVWLVQTENGFQELDITIDGLGPVMTGSFWFLDENTVLTQAVLSTKAPGVDELVSKWGWYLHERGEELELLVKSKYQYDSVTGRFSTDNQSLVGEKEGNLYFVEKISDKELVMRSEFAGPVYHDVSGLRHTLVKGLSPNLCPNFPYKVFYSNEEAIAYVKEVLGE